jgi:hypothetical protein
MEGGELGARLPVLVVGALEGQQHQLEAGVHAVRQVVQTLHIALVRPARALSGSRR